MTQVILGKSRVREICMPGSVRAKAEWLSYSTIGTGFGRSHYRTAYEAGQRLGARRPGGGGIKVGVVVICASGN
jgi:hypothetical protein